MGLSQSTHNCYAVQVQGSAKKGSSHVYRSNSHPDELVSSITGLPLQNCWDMFQSGLREKGDGPCIGVRRRGSTGALGPYKWRSYREFEMLATYAGSGLLYHNCVPIVEFPDEKYAPARKLRLVGLFMKNREEWFITEQAANAFNFAIVPLYDTLGSEGLSYILEQTNMRTVIAVSESIPLLLECCGNSKLETIIAIDEDLEADLYTRCSKMNVKLLQWKSVVEDGAAHEQPLSPGTREDVQTICYTSGTTGKPKGVILTHENIISTACALVRGPVSQRDVVVTKEEVYLSYLPLAHVFERIVCSVVILKGASIGVFSGDTMKLLDDLRELKPTVFASVPRLYNRINDKIFSGLADKPAIQQYLFNSGLNAKLSNLRRHAQVTHSLWDTLVFNKLRNLLGGRVRWMIVGGAPLNPLVQERMSCIFCCPLLEGYGMTESMGATFLQYPNDPMKGSVGGVVPAFEFKLISKPEMEAYVNEDPPKGELCMRGPGVSPGYFRNDAESLESFDEDGWLHTGDISVLLPNLAIKIVERSKNMFKLAQGEYVAPEKVEGVYSQALLVSQVFAFGYSTKPMLVGIVVPDPEMALKWAAKNGLSGETVEALCSLSEFKAAVECEMDSVAKKNELKGFEKIRDFKLFSEPFSVENNLLTPTFKLKRFEAKKRFQPHLDELYELIEGGS